MAVGPARRRNAIRIGAVLGAVALGSAGLGIAMGSGAEDAGSAPAVARATLVDTSGKPIGRVRFRAVGEHALRVRVVATGLAPGFHGFHIHETGTCDAPFTSAGGHYNPTAQAHGAHAGDMPPLLAGKDGRARAAFTTTSLTVDGLLDASGDGSAVVIHGGSDNLANIPSRYHSHVPDAASTTYGPDAETKAAGDAGARMACGVVRRVTGAG